MLLTLLAYTLATKGKDMKLLQLKRYGAVYSGQVGAVSLSDLKPWVLTTTTMAMGVGVFGAVLWGAKGAALGILLGATLGYVASHPDSPTALVTTPPK